MSINTMNKSDIIVPGGSSITSNITTPWHIPLTIAVYYTILSPITILGNGFLLLTFIKNHSTFLRAPSNFLLMSMAAANFLTGLVVEPLAGYFHYMLYLKRTLADVNKIAVATSMVTMNASVFSICAFSWEHFLVIHRPGQYKKWVNIRRIKIFIVFLWLYETIFALLPFMDIPEIIVYQIDLHFNTTVISLLLICSYVCLFLALKRQSQRVSRSSLVRKVSQTGTPTPTSTANITTSSDMERRVRWIIFLFTFLTTVHFLPITVVWYLKFYCLVCRKSLQLWQAEVVLSQFIFIKFALDPFVYAWRLSKYRSALRKALCCSTEVRCE